MSISEYTNSIRMTMAENLLSTTDLSIDEIAKQLGYNYSGNFVKMFKKTHGKTPLAFRKLKNLIIYHMLLLLHLFLLKSLFQLPHSHRLSP